MAKNMNLSLSSTLSRNRRAPTRNGNGVMSKGRGKERTILVATTATTTTTSNDGMTKKQQQKQRMHRSSSTPVLRRVHSAMKILTLDESLHSTYGRSKSCSDGLSTQSEPTKNVKWDNVNVREYERVLGDNPSCSQGPPVSIGWQYNISIDAPLDKYEETRPERRTNSEMLLPRSVRQDMLVKEWDVSRQQIASAVRSNVKVKNQRRNTVNNLNESTIRMEEMMEKVGRKFKRGLLRRSTSKETQKLQEEADKAAEAVKRLQAQEAISSYDDYDEDDVEEKHNDYNNGSNDHYQKEKNEGIDSPPLTISTTTTTTTTTATPIMEEADKASGHTIDTATNSNPLVHKTFENIRNNNNNTTNKFSASIVITEIDDEIDHCA